MRMALDQFAYAPVFIASMMAILLVLDVSAGSCTWTGCSCHTLAAAGCTWLLCLGTLLVAAVQWGMVLLWLAAAAAPAAVRH